MKPIRGNPAPSATVTIRTERRSWLLVAIAGFGALLVRSIKRVRQRVRVLRMSRRLRGHGHRPVRWQEKKSKQPLPLP
ncbi:MAG: hypothetical protein U1G07_25135 [Verrucomicrobiota bacterium]